MKKNLIYAVVSFLVGLVLGWVIWGYVPVKATQIIEQEEWTICHHNPSHAVTLTFNNENAYQNHLGQPHNEQVWDGEEGEKCDSDQTDLPSVDAVVSCGQVHLDFFNPTRYFFSFDYRKDEEAGTDDEVTGLNIANGTFAGQPFGQRYNVVDVDGRDDVHYAGVVVTFPEDSGTHTLNYRLWRGAENDWYIPWLEEGLTVETDCQPNPTPTPTPEPERGTSPAGAPQCSDSKPLVLPSNVHVVRNGSDATVNFFTNSSNANIYYRTSGQPVWQHALRDIPVTGGYVSVTIHDLVPTGDYDFGVQSANSCAGGEVVLAVVVDDWQPRTFMFSHFEWLK